MACRLIYTWTKEEIHLQQQIMIFDSIIMNSDHTLIFSPIDSHADDDIDTAGHEGVDERHHEMSLLREI